MSNVGASFLPIAISSTCIVYDRTLNEAGSTIVSVTLTYMYKVTVMD